MESSSTRRSALMGLSIAAAGLATKGAAASAQAAAGGEGLIPAGATDLDSLISRLAGAPRRRDFRSVPMVLEDPVLWDHEAIEELLAYKGGPTQIWDNTEIAGPWLNGMRNTLNAQIFSFRHPNFLIVSATHGQAQLALLDQEMWEKYQLSRQAGGVPSNTFFRHDREAQADRALQSQTGAYSAANDSIADLMDRGVIFLACHMWLWDFAGTLIRTGTNPDRLSHGSLVAEMTNHLAPGVVLTPGMAATILEFQQAGYHYIK
ncbi:MAG TPA: hypothetical protein VK801_13635 [Caulobacteraceae bacterium]|nr:hypothetical protein [Caulobacteraceae bacterium]